MGSPSGSSGSVATSLSSVPIVRLPGLLVVPNSSMLQSVDAPLVLIWLGLTVFLSVRIVRAIGRVWAGCSLWTPDQIGGSTVWMTDDLGPAVFGLLHPRVVLPRWLRTLPGEQVEMVLLHNREHIRSHDTWALALTVMLRLTLPWHVGFWYLHRVCAKPSRSTVTGGSLALVETWRATGRRCSQSLHGLAPCALHLSPHSLNPIHSSRGGWSP